MNKIKVAFLGTPEIAAAFLQSLNNKSDQYEIVTVITAPDKKHGRKMQLQQSPVKAYASEHVLNTYTPRSKKELIEHCQNVEFDVAIVVAYGMLIPKSILNKTEAGFVNVHFSLLPKYRGASPMQASLLAGDTETGVSIFKLTKGMDAGPIIGQKTIQIESTDTLIELSNKLTELGIELLHEVIPDYTAGKIETTEQDDSAASYCYKITKADGKVDCTHESAEEIIRKMRAYTPWPGCYTQIDGKQLKLLDLEKSDTELKAGIIDIKNKAVQIGTANGSLRVKTLQIAGKPAMSAEAFALGYQRYDGMTLS